MIGAVTSAALYGRAVFTTIAILDGLPFLWEKHWKRLQNDATKVGVDMAGYTDKNTKVALDELVAANAITNGRARITLFDESPSSVWPFDQPRKTTMLITTADARPVPETFRVEMSPSRVSSLSKTTAIKSCNYLDTVLAYEETRRCGFDEALRLNESGEVVSACMANVFWLKDGRLFTPDVKTGCVPGTTREFIVENLECEVVSEYYDSIEKADSIFLTSAGLGVVQVAEFAGKELPQVDHPIMHVIGESA